MWWEVSWFTGRHDEEGATRNPSDGEFVRVGCDDPGRLVPKFEYVSDKSHFVRQPPGLVLLFGCQECSEGLDRISLRGRGGDHRLEGRCGLGHCRPLAQ